MARAKKKPAAKKSATTRLAKLVQVPAFSKSGKKRKSSPNRTSAMTVAISRRPKESDSDGARRTTEPMGVRARFTDPLRRFNEHESIRGLIEAQAKALGDRTFLVFEDDGREYSFATLDEKTSRAANLLTELGAGPGARVAMLMQNSPEFVFVLLGAMKAGLIAVPVHSDLSIEQVRFALEDCGASVLAVEESLWPKIAGYYAELPGLHAVLIAGGGDPVSGRTVHLNHKSAAGVDALPLVALETALEAASAAPPKAGRPRWWDEAELLYTGHDLKNPRGAILQHRQFMTSARWLSVWLRLTSRDRVLNVLPLFHTNAQVLGIFAPLALGGTVVLSRDFNVARVWRAVERYRATALAAVPTMLGIMTSRELNESHGARGEAHWPAPQESPGALGRRDDADARERGLARGHDVSTLRMVVCGSAPLPRATLKAFEQCFLVPVIEGFSMTETTCFVSVNPVDGTRKLGSVGVGVGNKTGIQDDRHAPRPLEDNWQPTSLARMSPSIFPTANVGEPGEICVWGENVLKEYYRRPSVNPAAFAGGWFHTGDVGKMDADGYIYVLGPRGQQVHRDGEMFMPREIDEALFSHKNVEQAASIATTDVRKGSLVTTWVVMRKGTFAGGAEDGRLPANDEQQRAMQSQLKSWMSGQLGDKRQPSTLLFAPKIPQNAAGKTRIFDLKQLARRAHPGANLPLDDSEE